jgi:hypothetical protein
VVTELLGEEFGGIIGSDRNSAYSHLDDHRHQFYWAHLLRDFQAIIERKGTSTQIGTVLKPSGQELIHHWNRLQGGAIRRATFDSRYRRLRLRSLCDLLYHTFQAPTFFEEFQKSIAA